MVVNNVLLVVACAAVLLGTLYPLFYEVVGAGRISIGPPYFNRVFVPLMIPLFLLIGLGPSIRWRRGNVRELVKRLRWPFVIAVVLAIGVGAALWNGASVGTIAGASLAVWVMVTAWSELARRIRQAPAGRRFKLSRGIWGMSLAHFGAGVLLLGVTAASTMSSYLDISLHPGQSASVAGYHFKFLSAHDVSGPNYQGTSGTFRVTHDGQRIAVLQPQSRVYKGGMPTSESAISWKPTRDIYVAMGRPVGDHSWSVRLQVRPFVRFIWFGGLLIALGGVLALTDPRYRRRRDTTEGAA